MFSKLFGYFAIIVFAIFLAGCSHNNIDAEKTLGVAVKNMVHPSPNIFSSGQPSKDELASLANLGVKHVINLRPITEQDWDEGQYVESLGLSYHSIPVAGAAGITGANANLLKETLKAIGSEPVLVHCASGNRVGALMALSSWHEGGELELAIAEGRKWGLTGLEPLVRKALAN